MEQEGVGVGVGEARESEGEGGWEGEEVRRAGRIRFRATTKIIVNPFFFVFRIILYSLCSGLNQGGGEGGVIRDYEARGESDTWGQ